MTTDTFDPFDGSRVEVLIPPEGIRRRPGMYVGDTHDGTGLREVVLGLIRASVRRHREGRCHRVEVYLHDDGRVVVVDDSVGYGVEPDDDGETELVRRFTRFDLPPAEPRPLHGSVLVAAPLGVLVASALAEELVVDVRDGVLAHSARFSRGVLVEPVTCTGATDRVETVISFTPDAALLQDDERRFEPGLRWSLAAISALCPELRIHLRTTTERLDLRSPDGLADMLARHAPEGAAFTPTLRAKERVGDALVEVVLQWHAGQTMREAYSFANGCWTKDGGTHLNGVRGAIRSWSGVEYGAVDVRCRMAVHVELPAAVFPSSSPVKLLSREATPLVEDVTRRLLERFEREHPDAAGRARESLRESARREARSIAARATRT